MEGSGSSGRSSLPAGPRLVVEADGGSRGNPGVAGYGAVVRDAETGRVLVERAAPLGRQSNNVAEYRGIIAGLEAVVALAPSADVDVRLDSKLVIEQMAGRWKVRHEDMRRLSLEAAALVRQIHAAGGTVSWTWVPRERNAAADTLSNDGMDGRTLDTLPAALAHTDPRASGGSAALATEVPDATPADRVASEASGADILGGMDLRLRPDTLAVRAGLSRSDFRETSEALYLTSGFVYDSAEQAEAAFKDEIDAYIYSRYGNPTVRMFEERLRLLEGAEACFATASGMAAVFVALAALCAQGDRIVSSRALFGSCFVVVDEVLPRWGVESVLVDGPDLGQWRQALSSPATAVFFETPSNPMQELVDIRAVADLAHAAGAKVVVDNVFGTPVFSKPLQLGADVVVYSATKHLDGQGRVLGGAVLGAKEFIDGPVRNLMRHTGPAMSPFNAWTLLKGLETMSLRVERQSQNALTLAHALETHPAVTRVLHPWLESHPQHDLARAQMSGGGTVVTFLIDAGKDAAFRVMNALQVVDISNNLGDTKSLVTHPATTTHRRLTPEARAAVGITDGTIRISVGLEDPRDIIDDVLSALAHASSTR